MDEQDIAISIRREAVCHPDTLPAEFRWTESDSGHREESPLDRVVRRVRSSIARPTRIRPPCWWVSMTRPHPTRSCLRPQVAQRVGDAHQPDGEQFLALLAEFGLAS